MVKGKTKGPIMREGLTTTRDSKVKIREESTRAKDPRNKGGPPTRERGLGSTNKDLKIDLTSHKIKGLKGLTREGSTTPGRIRTGAGLLGGTGAVGEATILVSLAGLRRGDTTKTLPGTPATAMTAMKTRRTGIHCQKTLSPWTSGKTCTGTSRPAPRNPPGHHEEVTGAGVATEAEEEEQEI